MTYVVLYIRLYNQTWFSPVREITGLIYLSLEHSYETPEVALNCGMMLRECLRHEPLARIVLFSEEFYCFFRYVELSTFDIASDAFASFKVWNLHKVSSIL